MRAREDVVAGYRRWHDAIRDGLATLRDRGGLIDSVDVDGLATALLTSLQGGLLLAKVRREGRTFRDRAQHRYRPHRDIRRRLELDFCGELTWPGQVAIGMSVGRTSITLAQGLFQHDRCVALARTVIVQVDDDTHRATPLSAAAAARLVDLEPRG
jgi:hypothetical protein